MPRYSKKNNISKNKISDETIQEADKIARGTQRPGQTKEQTRLIAQGIQKGINQYKKQQKAKARELDKKLKQLSIRESRSIDSDNTSDHGTPDSSHKMPWFLLVVSWLAFAGYILFRETSLFQ